MVPHGFRGVSEEFCERSRWMGWKGILRTWRKRILVVARNTSLLLPFFHVCNHVGILKRPVDQIVVTRKHGTPIFLDRGRVRLVRPRFYPSETTRAMVRCSSLALHQ